MQQLQLSIPEPCHQDWNRMSPNEQGRFCGSCAKTVIDFSAMTDAQLIRYFENLKTENVCGRMHVDQLDRPIEPLPFPRKKLHWYWQYIVAFFMMAGKSQQAKAQGELKTQTTQQPDTAHKDREVLIIAGGIRRRPLPPKTSAIPATLPQYFIVDKNQQPVAGASIQLLPQGTWLVTDSAGRINLGLQHKVKALQISSVGFEDTLIQLKHIPYNNIIQLQGKTQSLENVVINSDGAGRRLGGMMGGLWITRTTIFSVKDSVQHLFNPAISVYPNPVANGGMLTLSLSLKNAGEYIIQLADASGKIVLQQNHIANGKASATAITLPAWLSSGIYFVVVMDKKGEKIGAAKVVLQ